MTWKKSTIIYCCFLAFSSTLVFGQHVRDFFYLEPQTKELPVFVRGNLGSEYMLLFAQGGYGETAIDFARSDYPGWKKTLEQDVAIAYFDERGLNQNVSHIDPASITYEQYGKDLLALADFLHAKYDRKIILIGHSEGGVSVYHALSQLARNDSLIIGSIFLNSTFTSDFSTKRYTEVRPAYLKNLAREFIALGKDTAYWREALNWMNATDSIHDRKTSHQWSTYTSHAFAPSKRKIGIGMVFRVIFSRPYNPIKYLYRKDNEMVSDLLWEDERRLASISIGVTNTQPALLITGRYDDIACPEEQVLLKKHLPNAEITILPNCGHESFLDQPALLRSTITTFLDTL